MFLTIDASAIKAEIPLLERSMSFCAPLLTSVIVGNIVHKMYVPVDLKR